jgi:PST family polysaccharide transporter
VVEYAFQLSATRELAAHRDSAVARGTILWDVTAAKLLLLGLAVIAAVVASQFFSYLSARPLLLWSATVWMAGHALNMMWFYQGIEKLKPAVAADFAAGIASTVAILSFVNKPGDGWKVLLFQGSALLVTALCAFYHAVSHSATVRPDWSRIVVRLRSGSHVFAYRFALGFYSTLNPVLLGWMAPVLAVGYFSGADKIARGLLLLVYPIAQGLYPRINYHRIVDSKKAARLAIIGLLVAAAIGIAAGAAAFTAAPALTRLLLGSQFLPAIGVLRILALLCPLIAVNTMLVYQWMLPRFLDAALIRVTVLAGVLNICMALLLVPRYAAVGMAWAVVGAEIFVLVGCSLVLVTPRHRSPG